MSCTAQQRGRSRCCSRHCLQQHPQTAGCPAQNNSTHMQRLTEKAKKQGHEKGQQADTVGNGGLLLCGTAQCRQVGTSPLNSIESPAVNCHSDGAGAMLPRRPPPPTSPPNGAAPSSLTAPPPPSPSPHLEVCVPKGPAECQQPPHTPGAAHVAHHGHLGVGVLALNAHTLRLPAGATAATHSHTGNGR